MFIGHFALGFASRKISKLPSLAMMFIAIEFLDLLWPIFSLLGIETFEIEKGVTKLMALNFISYPYSHSLLMAIVWGVVFGGGYFLATKNKQGSLLLGALVVSHWFLDLLVHRPDLPLTPFNDLKVGLGLWNYPVAELTLEFGLFFSGVFLYYKAARPKRKVAFWLLVAFFVVAHLGNIFGPLPTSTNEVAWTANTMWILVLWAWWLERKQSPKNVASGNVVPETVSQLQK